MTIAQLQAKLGLFTDDKLEVYVRCRWEGDEAGDPPPVNVFKPYVLMQIVDPDTGIDFVAIECDQTDED